MRYSTIAFLEKQGYYLDDETYRGVSLVEPEEPKTIIVNESSRRRKNSKTISNYECRNGQSYQETEHHEENIRDLNLYQI